MSMRVSVIVNVTDFDCDCECERVVSGRGGRADGRTDGRRTDGWTADGRKGRTDGRADGRTGGSLIFSRTLEELEPERG